MDNTQCKLVTFNVNGLRDPIKRAKLRSLIDTNNDIIALQEIHAQADDSSIPWSMIFPTHRAVISYGSSKSKGTALYVNRDYEVTRQLVDSDGRFALVEAKKGKFVCQFGSVYMPNGNANKSTKDEFAKIFDTIIEFMDEDVPIILAGDFNIIINKMDTNSKKNTRGYPDLIELMKQFLLILDLKDSQRMGKGGGGARIASWQRGNLLTRLDYVLVSSNFKKKAFISTPTSLSDHFVIEAVLSNPPSSTRGKSYWRMNDLLVKDEELHIQIRNCYPTWKAEANLLETARSRWDFLKFKISEKCRIFSRTKRKEEEAERARIKAKLHELAEILTHNPGDCEAESDLLVEKAKEDQFLERDRLRRQYNARVEGVACDEKPSKFFFRKMKQRQENSNIDILEDNGVEIDDESVISRRIKEFYSDLMAKKTTLTDEEIEDHDFWESINLASLSENARNACEAEITIADVRKIIFQKMIAGKAPGADGLSVLFYRRYWSMIREDLWASLQEGLTKGELSNTQKMSVIKLLLKKGKNRKKIGSYRPISLMNLDTKILAKAVAIKIQRVLPSIIAENQTAYVQGRNICEGIRTVQGVIDHCRLRKINGVMATIDFQKAFDSVEHGFLFAALKKFGFGKKFIKQVKTLYNGANSSVFNGGRSTGRFDLTRSTRQGCPLSAFLFVVAIEVLNTKIKQHAEILGITICGEPIKCWLFADDLTVFAQSEEELEVIFGVIEEFSDISGLVINRGKTEILPLGEQPLRQGWKNTVKITGTFVGNDPTECDKMNYESVLEDIKTCFNDWKGRKLTEMGRVLLANSHGIGKLNYQFSNSFTPDKVVKEAGILIRRFVWNGKADKINQDLAHLPVHEGGIGLPNVDTVNKAEKIKLILRAILEPDRLWSKIFLNPIIQLGGYNILFGSLDLKKVKKSCHNYPFLWQAIQIWNNYVTIPSPLEALGMSPWQNKLIRKPDGGVYEAPKCAVRNISLSDFVKEDGSIKGNDECAHLGIPVLLLHGLRGRINNFYKIAHDKGNLKKSIQMSPIHKFDLSLQYKKLKGIAKTIVRERQCSKPIVNAACRKFEEDYSLPNDGEVWSKIYKKIRKSSISTRYRSFEFRSCHNLLYANRRLWLFKLRDSARCNYCPELVQTTKHLFVSCPVITKLWEFVEGTFKVSFAMAEKMVGDINDPTKNLLSLVVRVFIYDHNLNDKDIIHVNVIKKIRNMEQIERSIAEGFENPQKITFHLNKWMEILNIINNLSSV